MFLRISKFGCLIACSTLLQMPLISAVSADTRITEDYIALTFEAEADDSRDERWVLMNAATPEQENDPDGNHSDGAVGGAYIELLPDMRVTHDDEFGPPTAIWHEPGNGPEALYTLDFPEAGRYYVHIRAFSTGTEDNGVHVGINDTWPMSGRRMQFCTAGQGWQWSGNQRHSGGAGACGAIKTIWVTVPEAGEHTIKLTPREDGFEADRVMLIKDLSDNTRICSPSGSNDINCVDGSLQNVDDVVDMAVSATVGQTDIGLGGSVQVSVIVRNDDGYDTASDVVLSVAEGVGTQWSALELPEGCDADGTSINCELGSVRPSFAGEEGDSVYEFTLEPLQSGALEIPVSIDTSSVDGTDENNSDNQTVNVTDDSRSLSALFLQLDDSSLTWQSNFETRVVATISNSGPGEAAEVGLSVSVPVGLTVSSLPDACFGTTEVQCSYAALAADAQMTVEIGITPTSAGLFSVSYAANASNHNGDAAARSIIALVAEEAETNPEEKRLSGGGMLMWWTLVVLSFALYMKRSQQLQAPVIRAHGKRDEIIG